MEVGGVGAGEEEGMRCGAGSIWGALGGFAHSDRGHSGCLEAFAARVSVHGGGYCGLRNLSFRV